MAASDYQEKIRLRKLEEANAAGRARGQEMKAQKRAEDAAAEWWATPTVPGSQPTNVPPATPPGGTPPVGYGPPPSPYVVKDGDTVDTIASNFGTTTTNLLNSNPDVTSIVPGLVLNPPKPKGPTPGSEAWRAQQNFGATNTPPRSRDRSGGTQGYASPNPVIPNPGRNVQGGGNMSIPISSNPGRNVQGGGDMSIPSGYPQQPSQQTNPNQYQPNRPTRGMPIYNESNLAPWRAYEITNLYNSINTGSTPTPAQVEYLINRGLITRPQPAPAYQGYAGQLREARRGRGGGGGGGGWGSGGGIRTGANRYNNDGLPAFAGGGGFRGLVNWRI